MRQLFYLFLIIFPLTIAAQQQSESAELILLEKKTDSLREFSHYREAIPLCQKAILLSEKIHGKESKNYIERRNDLGTCFSFVSGNKDEIEKFLLENIKIAKKFGEKSVIYADALDNAGSFYSPYYQGNVAALSVKYHKAALAIWSEMKNEKLGNYACTINNLAITYDAMGFFEEAEKMYKNYIQLSLEAKDSSNLAIGLFNLGDLYVQMGNFQAAEPLFIETLKIQKIVLGEKNEEYAATLENYADMHFGNENYEKSVELYAKARDIYIETGNQSSELGHAMEGLANSYWAAEKFFISEKTFENALPFLKNNLGEKHYYYGIALHDYGELLRDMGKYADAERILNDVIRIRKEMLGEIHQKYTASKFALTQLYQIQQKNELAAKLYASILDEKKRQILNNFPFLSENEKTAFHNNTCKYIFENFNAFVLSEFLKNGEKTDKKLISRFFDGQLFSKAILLQASQKMKNRILNSSDTILIKKFNQWAELRKEISSHEQMSEEERSESEINADSIKLVANEIEKYLSRASESFANLTENKSVSWKDLQAKLKDDEMCIEIVRVRKFGLKKLITDLSDTLKAPNFPKYPLYGLNDSVYYVALLLKKNDKFPIFLPLENGTYLENSGINFYRNAVRFHVLDTVSYRNFFAKIFKNIKGIKKVYFSPDGVYNQLNINTLYIPEMKKYLQEVLEIHQLTNSKDILTFASMTEKKEAKSGFAALFGRPSFLLSDSAPKPAESAPVMRDVATRGLRSVRGTDLTDLPGTEIEVKQIDSLLQKRAFSTKSFLATEATEENLKKIENPNILHIATHGFFIPQENKLNPMLLSGVLLAGVSNFLAGSDSAEDGILTAFEAQNLNLEKTELVVLSACETALGSVRSGEGVYGLQRAFKVAGAKSLLMSLWKVDDRVTQELMSAFYAHYVENKSIRNSFVKAQADIRKKYPQPFYWGAFVLIGE